MMFISVNDIVHITDTMNAVDKAGIGLYAVPKELHPGEYWTLSTYSSYVSNRDKSNYIQM